MAVSIGRGVLLASVVFLVIDTFLTSFNEVFPNISNTRSLTGDDTSKGVFVDNFKNALEDNDSDDMSDTGNNVTVNLPASFSGFRDISDPREHKREHKDDIEENDMSVPLFWHIPKSGGSTMKGILAACYRMCMASDSFGVRGGHDQDEVIARIHSDTYVNVEVASSNGIRRAKKMGLAQSGLAEIIVTPRVYEIASVFDESHQGVVFAMFRHPVDRAVSTFNYLSYATWEETYNPKYAEMTLEEYGRGTLGEDSNWMVRMITDRRGSAVTRADLEIAKEFLRKKVLVGLLSEIEESVERFDKFFRWTYSVNPKNQETCRSQEINEGANVNKEKKIEVPQPGSVAYELLVKQNYLDIELYEFAEALFKEQKAWFEDIPDGFRFVDSSCCKCEGTC
mmetsp:Transcript_8496/g.12362  ORF Transcript_8496/g.12362 Transcript_8496/m.12362 type:complete len:395 (+) Transcript_8496:114-1298(+)|eukprot:CAMPEP_0195507956 /NCGR_PEP_ID=MMETSP0794_2-20130614/1291_1 /TAXON_ID=515487 /ORGANISM="Stephanopyxis turris, Strain CCMP 815" /LENGTH=394 /DNA_ID=CAMNT_0040634797 /DNA_START=66 /DNA_END=1250 /DNA_ORIENTATION=+